MTASLWHSINSNLTQKELTKIDERVIQNRQSVYLFGRKLSSNSKKKVKKVYLYGRVLVELNQPLQIVPAAGAVMMPVPTAINRLSPSEQDRILKNKNSYPQVASLIKGKINKIVLTNQQIEDFNSICSNLQTGSITLDEAVLKLRAGGFYEWATLAVVISMFILQESYGFQNVPLPHMDPMGWAAGKYDSSNAGSPQSRSNTPSRFERETFDRMKQMCHASADENGFVMSYAEAYKLVADTYTGSMQVTDDFRITDWQAASHLYHGIGVGVNPDDFGLTQAQLVKIQQEGGFIKYVQRGNKLPSIEHVRAYQKSLMQICLDPSTNRTDTAEYYHKHGVTTTTVFQNDRYLVCFNQTTGDLITGDKQKVATLTQFDQTNQIGSPKWIDKWSKK